MALNILAVMSHPDDEAFAISGTIKLLTDTGHRVTLIETTDGSAGQVHQTVAHKHKALGSVKALRQEELKAAAGILGIADIIYFDHPDGTLNNSDVFDDFLGKEIKAVMKKEKPDIIISYDHTGISWHLDHIATSLATAKVCYENKALFDKYFMFTLTSKHELNSPYVKAHPYPVTHSVDIRAVAQYKEKALKSHETQRKDWERFFAREDNEALKTENYHLVFDNQRSDEIFHIFKPVKA